MCKHCPVLSLNSISSYFFSWGFLCSVCMCVYWVSEWQEMRWHQGSYWRHSRSLTSSVCMSLVLHYKMSRWTGWWVELDAWEPGISVIVSSVWIQERLKRLPVGCWKDKVFKPGEIMGLRRLDTVKVIVLNQLLERFITWVCVSEELLTVVGERLQPQDLLCPGGNNWGN